MVHLLGEKNNIPYVPWDTTVIEYIAKSRGIEKSEVESFDVCKFKNVILEIEIAEIVLRTVLRENFETIFRMAIKCWTRVIIC